MTRRPLDAEHGWHAAEDIAARNLADDELKFLAAAKIERAREQPLVLRDRESAEARVAVLVGESAEIEQYFFGFRIDGFSAIEWKVAAEWRARVVLVFTERLGRRYELGW